MREKKLKEVNELVNFIPVMSTSLDIGYALDIGSGRVAMRPI